jgi:hypothetical protein
MLVLIDFEEFNTLKKNNQDYFGRQGEFSF